MRHTQKYPCLLSTLSFTLPFILASFCIPPQHKKRPVGGVINNELNLTTCYILLVSSHSITAVFNIDMDNVSFPACRISGGLEIGARSPARLAVKLSLLRPY